MQRKRKAAARKPDPQKTYRDALIAFNKAVSAVSNAQDAMNRAMSERDACDRRLSEARKNLLVHAAGDAATPAHTSVW